jgi:hypothetical protein
MKRKLTKKIKKSMLIPRKESNNLPLKYVIELAISAKKQENLNESIYKTKEATIRRLLYCWLIINWNNYTISI